MLQSRTSRQLQQAGDAQVAALRMVLQIKGDLPAALNFPGDCMELVHCVHPLESCLIDWLGETGLLYGTAPGVRTSEHDLSSAI
jgi:hypothetical protein